MAAQEGFHIQRLMGSENLPYAEALRDLWRRNLDITCPGRAAWLYPGNPSGTTWTWLATESASPQNHQKDDSGSLGLKPPTRMGREAGAAGDSARGASSSLGSSAAVGCATVLPRAWLQAGLEVAAGLALDFMVAPEHRVFGPALALQRQIVEARKPLGLNWLLACPNAAARGLFIRLGYRVLGWQTVWVKILRSRPQLEKILRWGPLTALVGAVADWIINLPENFRPESPALRGWSEETLRRADARFDDLWRAVREHQPLLGDRRSAYLNWRYADCPIRQYEFFCVSESAAGPLVGAVVFYRLGAAVQVADVIWRDAEALDGLLRRFVRLVRRQGAASIALAYLGTRSLTDALGRLRFWKRMPVRECFLLSDQYSGSGLDLMNPEAWSLFEGDMDL